LLFGDTLTVDLRRTPAECDLDLHRGIGIKTGAIGPIVAVFTTTKGDHRTFEFHEHLLAIG